MDQNVLVSSGQALISALDHAGIRSRVAMWVHNTDYDRWKLWIVPPKDIKDKFEFYRRVSEIVSQNRIALGGIDASDTEMVFDSHPAMRGLSGMINAPGINSIHVEANNFNGFFLPDGIIIRSDM